MSLDSVVNIQITRTAAPVSRVGFGVALIVGENGNGTWAGSEYVKTFTSASAMLDDGFTTSDAEYKAALKLMSQTIQPTSFKIGKRSAAVAQVVTVTIDTQADATAYTVSINGTAHTYTSAGSGDTIADIRDGLLAAINAGDAGDVLTATPSSTDAIILTADTAGVPFTFAESDSNLSSVNTTASNGLPEDLVLIANDDDDWYAMVLASRNNEEIIQAAAYIESRRKIFVACTSDAGVLTDTSGNIAARLKAASYARTAYLYSADQANYPEAAWLGGQLPKTPGSVTYKFKTLAGITVDSLTATQTTNLDTNNANYYTTVGGAAITQPGKMAVGEWIDIIIGIDWIHANMQADIYDALRSEDKIPYTDGGVTQIANLVSKRLRLAVAANILAEDPAPAVTQPLVANVAAADKASRTLNNVAFTATASGAIHAVNVTGNISV